MDTWGLYSKQWQFWWFSYIDEKHDNGTWLFYLDKRTVVVASWNRGHLQKLLAPSRSIHNQLYKSLPVEINAKSISKNSGADTVIVVHRSNKLKPFWLSITEKETLPVLDFLSAALLSAEYDRALSRALAMAECPVVPFFGAFLRELREILAPAATASCNPHEQDAGGGGPSCKPAKADARRDQQQRQVVGKNYLFRCRCVCVYCNTRFL